MRRGRGWWLVVAVSGQLIVPTFKCESVHDLDWIRSPNRPARSKSLYTLSYCSTVMTLITLCKCSIILFMSQHKKLFPNVYIFSIFLPQGCTNPGRQFSRATKFCTVAPSIRVPRYWSCSCHPSGIRNVEVAPILFLENLCAHSTIIFGVQTYWRRTSLLRAHKALGRSLFRWSMWSPINNLPPNCILTLQDKSRKFLRNVGNIERLQTIGTTKNMVTINLGR